jgi:uncharacterized coiled-coil DUF342 family protein
MVGLEVGSPVLLVGDIGPRLEGDLMMAGISCALASTANDAVACMKASHFPVVVVAPLLADMGGVDFVQGVLRHFDANVVLYGNGIESGQINALLRTGRVAHFSGDVGTQTIADFLTRRSRTPAPSSSPASTALGASSAPPSFAGAAGAAARSVSARAGAPPMGAGMPFSSAPPPPFNLTPGSSAQPAGQSLAASLFGPPDPPGAPPTSMPSSPPMGRAGAFSSLAPARAPTPPPKAGSVPRPPTMGPMASALPPLDGAALHQLQADARLNQQRMEAMADDLARTNAELVMIRGQLAASEQERAGLLVEVEAARRSAMAQVAEVMALSDEGDPISEEIEELKGKATAAESELQRAWSEADALRTERDKLVGELAERAGAVAEGKARLDSAEAVLKEAQGAAADAQKELASTRAELDAVRLDLERLKGESITGRGEADELRAERDAARGELEGAKGALAAAQKELEALQSALVDEKKANEQLVSAKGELEAALNELEATGQQSGEVTAALRIEVERLKSDVAAARTDATTVRLDLQEAVMRLDEATASQQALGQERDALRAEAGPLREWATTLVAEHAAQQGELERLRAVVATAEANAALVAELQEKVKALEAERDRKPAAPPAEISGDVEVLLARSRQMSELVRALEPFMYGLTQAAGFYTKQAVPGGEAHLRLLQQLQGVLLRLRDEIAMLDLA